MCKKFATVCMYIKSQFYSVKFEGDECEILHHP